MIWSILHVNLIWSIDWYHHKILLMNVIETIKYHVHSLLINFTVEFLLGVGPLYIVRHSWNDVHWLFVINTTCKHICKCCITLHHHHFYFYPYFVLFLLLFHSHWIISSEPPRPCVLDTPQNSIFPRIYPCITWRCCINYPYTHGSILYLDYLKSKWLFHWSHNYNVLSRICHHCNKWKSVCIHYHKHHQLRNQHLHLWT